MMDADAAHNRRCPPSAPPSPPPLPIFWTILIDADAALILERDIEQTLGRIASDMAQFQCEGKATMEEQKKLLESLRAKFPLLSRGTTVTDAKVGLNDDVKHAVAAKPAVAAVARSLTKDLNSDTVSNNYLSQVGYVKWCSAVSKCDQ
jgi:hypothetical protein